MPTATGSHRRAQALAGKRAAKEKRQKIMAIGGVALLVVLLAYEVPHTLSLLKGSSGSSPPASSSALPSGTSATPGPAAAQHQSSVLKAALRQPPHDLFVGRVSPEPTSLGSIATPPKLHDPFAASGSSSAAITPPVVTKPKAPTLPGTIVVGTPGAGKVARQGWIVILASIPTDQGESAATSFAKQAQKAGVGKVSVLNSSNRRPLRGGYWVVYTGPYASLNAVGGAATKVQHSGFTSAYIRQLVVYKAKSTTTK